MTKSSSGSLRPSTRSSVRSTGSKKVYGKRNVTSAILEHESIAPTKPSPNCDQLTESDSDHLVDIVQEKLAAVTINEQSCDDPKPKNKSQTHVEHHRDESETTTSGRELGTAEGLNDTHGEKAAASVLVPARESSHKIPKSKKHRTPHACYVEDQAVHSYARPILEQAVSNIASKGVQQFKHWARGAGDRFRVEKIAEGSYGEVYQLHLCEGISKREFSKAKLSMLRAYDAGIFKIVPLRAQKGPGSKKFTSVEEIVSEVQLLRLLDPIPGFVRFREVHVVQGRFPAAYQEAWVNYSQNNDDCFNPDPSNKRSYPDTQLWAILEMDNAGYELEKFRCSSVSQIYDIFWGVALGLARAEQLSGFEHRDLHLGNICVKPQETQTRTSASDDLERAHTGFGLSGMETTIIDYSLSRAEFQSVRLTEKANIASSDLDKKKIFDAIGRDEEEKFLRDTYRRMRSHVYQNNQLDGKSALKAPKLWKSYNPGTNLIWLSFLLTMLLGKYSSCESSPARQPLGDRDPNRQITDRAKSLQYGKTERNHRPTSGADSNLPDAALQHELLERLEAVQGFLDAENGADEVTCAGDLVATAIGLEWLAESDFLC